MLLTRLEHLIKKIN